MRVLRLIAPSGPFNEEDFRRGAAFLREHFEVRFRDDIQARDGFLAGSDERRFDELRDALLDTEADAIVAVRGGHGATRILESLDVDLVRNATKPIVGFSDITALHLLWARAGITSLHAPMVGALGRDAALRPSWLTSVANLLDAKAPAPFTGLTTWREGEATGRLLGGNLRIVATLAESAHAPRLEGAILLLEDVGERAYRVDRMLTSLRLRGALKNLAGVVIGDFHECHPSDEQDSESVLRAFFRDAPYPVLAGLPVGHGARNAPVQLGVKVSIRGALGAPARLEYLKRS